LIRRFGATDHITSELDKLSIQDKYNGVEQVHTASGSGMKIVQYSPCSQSTPTHNLKLCNILHVPKETKNLMSVHRFTLDNNVFFEIHPWFFFIKNRDMRSTLLRGQCRDGLYPIPTSHLDKFTFGVNKPSLTIWHERLGHPALQIVERVLRSFNLPFQQESNKDGVCGSCQQAESSTSIFQIR
jgi:hypothetical protein